MLSSYRWVSETFSRKLSCFLKTELSCSRLNFYHDAEQKAIQRALADICSVSVLVFFHLCSIVLILSAGNREEFMSSL